MEPSSSVDRVGDLTWLGAKIEWALERSLQVIRSGLVLVDRAEIGDCQSRAMDSTDAYLG